MISFIEDCGVCVCVCVLCVCVCVCELPAVSVRSVDVSHGNWILLF
jgi:hypothetical protein